MLIITEQHKGDVLTFKLAGTLAGDWVVEFMHCWRGATTPSRDSRVTVDLTEVTFVDDIGRDLLRSMLMEGAELIAQDIMMKSIVEEITNEASVA